MTPQEATKFLLKIPELSFLKEDNMAKAKYNGNRWTMLTDEKVHEDTIKNAGKNNGLINDELEVLIDVLKTVVKTKVDLNVKEEKKEEEKKEEDVNSTLG